MSAISGSTGVLTRQSMAFVLAGGRGSRLQELTERRAKPAVFFGGKSRIIDFALSNAVNSGIRRIGVATQYKAHSLIRHLQLGWSFFQAERNEMLDVLPASQRVDERQWYLGTADAVTQNIDIIESYGVRYIVVLAGDHIYKMDYGVMLAQHVDSGADVTVGCIEVPRMGATGFGVMHVDEASRIVRFVEKPDDPPGIPGDPDHALASMGIYVFETAFLIELLRRDAADPDSDHDFGKNLIPHVVENGKAVAHRFSDSCVMTGSEPRPYWRERRHRRFLLARQHRPDRLRTRARHLLPRLADLDLRRGDPAGQVHPRRRGPARLRGFLHGLRRLHHLGLQRRTEPALHRRPLPFLQPPRGRGRAALQRHRAQRAPDPGGPGPGRAHSESLVAGEDREEDAKRFRVTSGGITLITQPMIDAL